MLLKIHYSTENITTKAIEFTTELFNDRVEIANPGGLESSISINEFATNFPAEILYF